MEWLSTLPWGKIVSALGGLGVAGVLAGGSNALIAHWLSQRKERTVNRRAKISRWSRAVHAYDWDVLMSSREYSEMRQHLRPDVVRDAENPLLVVIPSDRAGDPVKHMLLDEIARLEKEWGLI